MYYYTGTGWAASRPARLTCLLGLGRKNFGGKAAGERRQRSPALHSPDYTTGKPWPVSLPDVAKATASCS